MLVKKSMIILRKKSYIIFLMALAVTSNLLLSFRQDPAAEIVPNQKSRLTDAWGSGQFLAQRDQGERTHNGLDIKAQPGEKAYAPFDGTIVREAVPYKDNPSYRGLVLKGTGAWALYEVKIFYVTGEFSGAVNKGQEIGVVQDLTSRYPGITNHLHVEARTAGVLTDPFELWKISF